MRLPKLGGGLRDAVEHDRLDDPLGKGPRIDPPQIRLEPAHNDRLQIARPDRHPARKPLPVEHLQEGRKAVRMPVMRRRGQKEPMLETVGQVAEGLGEPAVDRIAGAARGCRVMRLVEDQQRSWSECAQQGVQAGDIGLIG